MAVAFFALMALLSVASLSFAIPATAASYLVETVLARYILKEHIEWRRWAGASLVAFGVALLALREKYRRRLGRPGPILPPPVRCRWSSEPARGG